jgi:hypothetical protein
MRGRAAVFTHEEITTAVDFSAKEWGMMHPGEPYRPGRWSAGGRLARSAARWWALTGSQSRCSRVATPAPV